MTELEKQLLSALQQLEQDYSQRDTALKTQLVSLQQQVQTLSKQVHELTAAYNQVVDALREA